MTKSPQKNVPDVGIELRAACMPNGHSSDRATAPGFLSREMSCVTLLGTLLEHLIISKPLDGSDSYMVGRYGSRDFVSTTPTPTHGLKVKVTELEVYS